MALHAQCVLIDGHNDVLMLRHSRGRPYDLMKVDRRYHSDGPRLIAGGMTASLFMVHGHELAPSLEMIARVYREVARHPDALMLITETGQIRRAKRSGRLGIVMSWESLMALESSMEVLHIAHRLGVRASTVTHGEGGGEHQLQGTPSVFRLVTARDRARHRRTAKGLTPFGKQVIREMNRLGMLIDVAHANDRTFDDILALSAKPVVSTHGGVFACCPHARCSTDEQIKALAAGGGLLSIAFYPGFIAPPGRKATADGIVDQILYVAGLVGIDHVGIGTDFDGISGRPVIRSAERLPVLTEAMLRRGLRPAEIRKVWGGNYLRVLKETIG
ncbi:MAG: dipeptidase [Kiritimatiellae bacterium]|nr:dipeptidase [Kiritimatiellia bacterium]